VGYIKYTIIITISAQYFTVIQSMGINIVTFCILYLLNYFINIMLILVIMLFILYNQ